VVLENKVAVPPPGTSTSACGSGLAALGVFQASSSASSGRIISISSNLRYFGNPNNSDYFSDVSSKNRTSYLSIWRPS
jgi:hypothetical protein